MPALSEDLIRSALAKVRYPGFSRDILSFGLLKDLQISGADVTVALQVTAKDPSIPQTLQNDTEAALRAVPGVGAVTVKVEAHAPAGAPAAQAPTPIEGVRHVIAVASGKGGVGKSTVAVNLALALAKTGASVGLCDCDVYGPSIALMFGSRERPMATADDQILPIETAGLKVMSMGFLLDDAAPAVMRGPMVTRTTQQLLRQVEWGTLDYLILDLPPGTGDIQLTIVQTVLLAGAVLVTTPQEVALLDVRKAASMFAKVNVPLLGVLENMSYFLCPDNGKRYDIFGTGGGKREAERLGVPLLGEIPLDIPTREAGDRGRPIVTADEQSPVTQAFLAAAAAIRSALTSQ
ncbi:MAG: Mrp/NBP35 family ATP-binding protein [Chthoniobacteraceae bacterium]|nr:Mrp/NBP35 family ATP-binding protein [Chthoniobacteraceae bacterium]